MIYTAKKEKNSFQIVIETNGKKSKKTLKKINKVVKKLLSRSEIIKITYE